jgi:putative SbcD/Mre11-related phosphoesterase
VESVEVLPGVRVTAGLALHLVEEATLVIGDLHLGYEAAMEEAGVALPRMNQTLIRQRLEALLDAYRPERVVVNGDFKHDFAKNLAEEWVGVAQILELLKARCTPVLVRGNHDNFLMTIAESRGVELRDRFEAGGFTFVHGHEDVDVAGPVVIGHEHPAVKLRDEIGAVLSLPAFVVTDDVIVLPAFSPLALGVDVASYPYLSPILNRHDLADGRVYAVDEGEGVLPFGRVADLKRARASLVLK